MYKLPTALFIDPVCEKVHSSNLRQLMILTKQPENLLTAVLLCLSLYSQCRCIVTAHYINHINKPVMGEIFKLGLFLLLFFKNFGLFLPMIKFVFLTL